MIERLTQRDYIQRTGSSTFLISQLNYKEMKPEAVKNLDSAIRTGADVLRCLASFDLPKDQPHLYVATRSMQAKPLRVRILHQMTIGAPQITPEEEKKQLKSLENKLGRLAPFLHSMTLDDFDSLCERLMLTALEKTTLRGNLKQHGVTFGLAANQPQLPLGEVDEPAAAAIEHQAIGVPFDRDDPAQIDIPNAAQQLARDDQRQAPVFADDEAGQQRQAHDAAAFVHLAARNDDQQRLPELGNGEEQDEAADNRVLSPVLLAQAAIEVDANVEIGIEPDLGNLLRAAPGSDVGEESEEEEGEDGANGSAEADAVSDVEDRPAATTREPASIGADAVPDRPQRAVAAMSRSPAAISALLRRREAAATTTPTFVRVPSSEGRFEKSNSGRRSSFKRSRPPVVHRSPFRQPNQRPTARVQPEGDYDDDDSYAPSIRYPPQVPVDKTIPPCDRQGCSTTPDFNGDNDDEIDSDTSEASKRDEKEE